jgi:hypothetical protein
MYTPTLAPAMSPTGEGTVGVYGYDTVYGPTIYYDFTMLPIPMYPSEIITVTFAFHWPYSTPVWGVQCHGGFVYDNYEMSVLSMVPAGPFVGGANNFPSSATWQGPFNPTGNTTTVWHSTMGTVYTSPGGYLVRGVQVGSFAGVPLWNNPPLASSTMTTAGYVHLANSQLLISGSGIYPFAQIQFHLKTPYSDGLIDAFYNSFALLFWLTPSATGSTYWTAGGIAQINTGTYSTHTTGSVYNITSVTHWGGSYGFGVCPEPASLTLLGLGLASVGAGVWRRRRR